MAKKQIITQDKQTNKDFIKNYIINPLIAFAITYGIAYVISFLFFDFNQSFFYMFPASMGFISAVAKATNTYLNENENKEIKPSLYIIFSVVLVTLSLFSLLAAHNMTPFGDVSIMILDIPHQYIPFNFTLKDAIANNEGIIYSHNLGLGSDFYGMITYYLCSIYNLLLLLLPKSSFLLAYTLMSYLKIISTTITFGIFYYKTYKKSDFSLVIFSSAYSLMSYIIIQISNSMWIDCLILMPLVIMYLHELLEKKSFWKYSLVLGLTIITNYYIAYMICIYLVLYYIIYTINNSEKFSIKEHLKNFWTFAYSSVIAGGLSAIITIPAIYNLSKTLNTKLTPDVPIWNYIPFRFFEQFFFGVKASIKTGWMPNVYCSVFVLFLLILFWACRGISLKKKITYSCLFIFITFSLSFYWLDIAWQGFHEPVQLPGRYSFLLSFTMILMAIDVWNNFESINFKALFLGFIVIPFAIAMIIIEGRGSILAVIGTIALIITYFTILLLYKKNVIKKATSLTLVMLIVFGELTASAVISRDFPYEHYAGAEYSKNCLNSFSYLTEKLVASDNGIYRVENIPHMILNDGSYNGLKTLTYFSSTNNGKIVTFMDKMGYSTNKINTFTYKDFVPFIDSFLGLKYIIFTEKKDDLPYLKYLYNYESKNRTFYIYENKLFTPLAFGLPNEIENYNLSEDKNPFEMQNGLSQIISGEDLYEKVEFTYTDKGIIVDENNNAEFKDGLPSVQVNFKIPEEGRYYFYHDVKIAGSLELIADKKNIRLEDTYNYITDAGIFKKGEIITFNVTKGQGSVNCYLYKLNEDVLEKVIKKIQTNTINFDAYESTEISGSINMKEDGIMFMSIVNDGGWTVTVDGKDAEIVEIADCFIGLKLSKGEHKIKMNYHNYSIYLGLVITLLSIAAILLITFLNKRKKTAQKVVTTITN